ncbi:UNVERIFIED_CONTAM: hypothetical protein RF648_18830, partial [Kocuria sp. CPCC 205274]
IAALVVASVSGCDDSNKKVIVQQAPVQGYPAVQPQEVMQQPATVVVQQPPVVVQQHDSTGHLLTGMALGHMMANSGGGRSNGNTTVINKTYTKKVYVQPKQQTRKYYGSRYNPVRASGFSRSRRR